MDLKERIELTRQTLDAIERVEANKGSVPDGFVLEYYDATDHSWGWSGLNDGTEQRFVMHYRLRSITPRQIPLGPEDVPPGSVFSYSPKHGWFNANVSPDGVNFFSHGSNGLVSWEEAAKELQIKRPGEDWRLCSKDGQSQ